MSWLLFQYSRMANYQRCLINPLSSVQQVTCDCQKQSPEAATGDKPHSTENATYKFRPDEVFIDITPSLQFPPKSVLLSGATKEKSRLFAGCNSAIFQPPRGNVSYPLFI
jgi:hypothetical protein